MQIELLFSKEKVPYPQAVEFMRKRVIDISSGNAPSCLWFLEHPSIYTAGRGAKAEELLQPNLPVYDSERGGKYTYHGPGQRIVYLMLDLQKIFRGQPDVAVFVKLLEDWIIKALSSFNISAFARQGRVGVWVEQNQQEAKIAAIGIRMRRWVSLHGIALNVNPNLEYYQGIIPCGISEYSVTSVNKLNPTITMNDCDKALLNNFWQVFNYTQWT
jgi:lipoyl(octanoyl) transferase